MKDKLQAVLERTVNLLQNCELEEKAAWFSNQLERLRNCSDRSIEAREVAAKVRSILGGMGSFSDLSLQPSAESKLSEREASEIQWGLAEELHDITGQILK